MDLKTYCDQARGNQAKLAAAIKVPAVSVSHWANGLRAVPLRYVIAIQRATSGAVTPRELRPDDWDLYWPDPEGDAS